MPDTAALSPIERARYEIAKKIAEQRAATYLIAPYLRGDLDDSEDMQKMLAALGNHPQLAEKG